MSAGRTLAKGNPFHEKGNPFHEADVTIFILTLFRTFADLSALGQKPT